MLHRIIVFMIVILSSKIMSQTDLISRIQLQTTEV